MIELVENLVVAAFVLVIIAGVFAWFTVLPVFGLVHLIGRVL